MYIYVHIVELIRLAPQYIKLRLVLYDTACVGVDSSRASFRLCVSVCSLFCW